MPTCVTLSHCRCADSRPRDLCFVGQIPFGAFSISTCLVNQLNNRQHAVISFVNPERPSPPMIYFFPGQYRMTLPTSQSRIGLTSASEPMSLTTVCPSREQPDQLAQQNACSRSCETELPQSLQARAILSFLHQNMPAHDLHKSVESKPIVRLHGLDMQTCRYKESMNDTFAAHIMTLLFESISRASQLVCRPIEDQQSAAIFVEDLQDCQCLLVCSGYVKLIFSSCTSSKLFCAVMLLQF